MFLNQNFIQTVRLQSNNTKSPKATASHRFPCLPFFVCLPCPLPVLLLASVVEVAAASDDVVLMALRDGKRRALWLLLLLLLLLLRIRGAAATG
jgi:hypothetical protein